MTGELGAAQWLDGVTVDDDVVARWPHYRLFLVAVDEFDAMATADVARSLLADAEAAVRSTPPDALDPHVARWHDAYRDFGVKPRTARVSVDALARRARSERGLPRIGPLVDLYNVVSVLHQVPIGGEDLDRYDGSAALTLATGDEAFATTADGAPVVEHPTPGEPVWTDAAGVTCRRWNWRQTTRTAITADTQRVGFIIDSLDAPDHRGAERAAEQLAELLGAPAIRTVG